MKDVVVFKNPCKRLSAEYLNADYFIEHFEIIQSGLPTRKVL